MKINAERDSVVNTKEPPNKVLVSQPNFDEATVKKLEAFFSQDEPPICEISTKLTFDGLQLNLFSDTDEVKRTNFTLT